MNTGQNNIFQTSIDQLAAQTHPAAFTPTNLPASRTALVGREEESRLICRFLTLEHVRLVTLTGFGGAGKTTLALHTARLLLEQFPDGVFFVDLAAINDPALILPAIVKALNLAEEAHQPPADTLRDTLAFRQMLFVLDNFEQVIEGAALIAGFLDANPHVRLLITSREALRLRGEQVIPLPPLPAQDAFRLFTQCAQALDPAFRVNEESAPSIAAICARLDGLPLAIELAAMRTRLFTPPALLERLQSNAAGGSPLLTTLKAGARDLPARQQTLRDAIAWSYGLLSESEQRTLRAAAVFPAGFGLRALGSVSGLPEEEALDILASLVDKHLIQPLPAERPRFLMLEAIGEFGREQARSLGEWPALRCAFIRHFQTVAQQAAQQIESGDPSAALARLDLEHDNILAALDDALGAADEATFTAGIALAEGLEQYWFQRCHYSEAEKFINAALEQAQRRADGQAQLLAIAHSLKGTLQWARYDFPAAAEHHRRAIAAYEQTGDIIRLGRAMNNLAANLDNLAQYEQAGEYYRLALETSRRAGDVWNELRTLNNMGIRCHHLLHDAHRAQECWQAALALAQSQARSYECATIEFNLACMWYTERDFARSESALQSAARTAQEKQYPQILLFARGLGSLTALENKDFTAAAALLLEAFEISQAIGEAALAYELVQNTAGLCLAQGQYEPAAILLSGAQAHTSLEAILRVLPAWPGLEKAAARLETLLGRERFAKAWEKGQNTAYPDLVAFAGAVCRPQPQAAPANPLLALLTPRELDTLRLLAQGKTNQQIAGELVVTLKTVEKHTANILRKLGVQNRTEAAAWALAQGAVNQSNKEK